MALIYRGSVKDIYQLDATSQNNLQFIYSDRYSIFDWGEMPDQIPYKGEALAFMAATFFEYLETKNIKSHYVGTKTNNSIEVKPVDVLRPTWDNGKYNYQVYEKNPVNCLVPLEIIFRYRLGMGNSLEKRLKKNPDYMQDIGLDEMPDAETTFSPALVEFSTKLESTDRYLNKKELAEMKALSTLELINLKHLTQTVALELKNLFSKVGVELWDGKVEYGFGENRDLFLVDSIGPDELRLTRDNLPLSKEFLRQIYTHTEWAKNVAKAKDMAKERSEKDWKKICIEELRSTPQKLSRQQLQIASDLYLALANELARARDKKLPFDRMKNLDSWSRGAQKILQEVSP